MSLLLLLLLLLLLVLVLLLLLLLLLLSELLIKIGNQTSNFDYHGAEGKKMQVTVPVAKWLERPTGVREVMGSIPVGEPYFSLSHARDNCRNIPSFSNLLLF